MLMYKSKIIFNLNYNINCVNFVGRNEEGKNESAPNSPYQSN